MFVSHPMLYPGKVEEREYQVKIAKSCMERPTLVVLHTALGKTIIAVMVIAEVLRTRKGKVLFLAPTKPLVQQHANSVREFVNTVEDIAVFTGEVAPSKRKDVWDGARIIVSTPQVIVNDLMAGKLTLEGIDLLVFDEAHRAVGDYAYVFIAEKFRAQGGLILGMTASPGSDPHKVLEVCANLGIQNVEIRTDYDPDVAPYIHDIREEWVRVSIPPEMKRVSDALRSAFKEYVDKLRRFGVLPKGKPASFSDVLAAREILQARLHSGGKDQSLYQALSIVAVVMKLYHAVDMAETQGYAALQNYLNKMRGDKSKAARTLVEDPRIKDVERVMAGLQFEHPKVQRVSAIVEEELRAHPDSRIIVFTNYREICDMINEELSKIEGARPVRFVGQATKGADRGLRQKEQIALIEKFKLGEANVLVATSVAEEGLDIPSTDLVILYEPQASEIRTIQRRGRTGRKHAGRIVYLITKGTKDEGAHFVSKRREREMHGELERLRDELRKHIALGQEPGEAFKTAFQAVVGARAGAANPSATPDKAPVTQNNPPQSSAQSTVKPAEPPRGQTSLAAFEAAPKPEVPAQCVKPVSPEIIVDSRELNSAVARELSKLGLVLKIETLEVGDYVISSRVAVERKEVKDFLASLLDQRLFGQVTAMKRAYQRPILIVEGEGLFTLRNISEQAIYGALASIASDFGVPVLFSKDALETAKYIQALFKREQGGDPRIPLRPGKGRTALHEQQQFVVEGLPGISATLAQRLLGHFGSVRAIMNASIEELCDVKGVGKMTAEQVKRVIEERYLEKGE
ncbi:MAG: DEAD/DEAH box helicase [Euryarchaeota archaeon]|nr:DEAD/DEAH box helicase [Euryarchaeota archaeon]